MQSHRKRGALAPAGLLGTLGAPPPLAARGSSCWSACPRTRWRSSGGCCRRTRCGRAGRRVPHFGRLAALRIKRRVAAPALRRTSRELTSVHFNGCTLQAVAALARRRGGRQARVGHARSPGPLRGASCAPAALLCECVHSIPRSFLLDNKSNVGLIVDHARDEEARRRLLGAVASPSGRCLERQRRCQRDCGRHQHDGRGGGGRRGGRGRGRRRGGGWQVGGGRRNGGSGGGRSDHHGQAGGER
jgi:hypothetical protein